MLICRSWKVLEKCVTVKSTSQTFSASFTAGGLIGPSIISARQTESEREGGRERKRERKQTQQSLKWYAWGKQWNKFEWCPVLNVAISGDFVQVVHRWDPSWDLSLLMSHNEEGWSGLISWTRRSPLAAQHRGAQHAILHYGEVPLGPLELRINPNLAAFHRATCQTEQTLEMNYYFFSLRLKVNNQA